MTDYHLPGSCNACGGDNDVDWSNYVDSHHKNGNMAVSAKKWDVLIEDIIKFIEFKKEIG